MRATKVEALRRNSAIKLQSIVRRHSVIQQVNKLREYFAVLGAERTMRLETHSSTVIQTWWRHTIYQRKLARDATFRERVLLENAAATAIVSWSDANLFIISYLFVYSLLLSIISAILLPWVPRLRVICCEKLLRGPTPGMCEAPSSSTSIEKIGTRQRGGIRTGVSAAECSGNCHCKWN